MSDSEPNDLDREVDDSMRLFERSRVGAAAMLPAIVPARVLLVLDGSPQDQASIAAAEHLRQRHNTETVVLDARVEPDDAAKPEELAVEAAKRFSGARPIARGDGDPHDAILAAIATHQVDLIIVPCPYGRSFEAIGTDSAGTVIDVLLSNCRVPMLVIRRDDQRLRDSVAHLAVVIGSECDIEARAASWAFGLAAENADVTLNLVIEKEHYENMRSIFEAISPDQSLDAKQFGDAVAKTHQSLHGSMAKTAAARNVTYRLLAQAGGEAPPTPLEDRSHLLIVIPLEVDDRFGQGFAQDRIRRSPHPVLIVPSHVQ